MSKYDTVYFVGYNETIKQAQVDSSKTRNQGAFLDSLAALMLRIYYPRDSSHLSHDAMT